MASPEELVSRQSGLSKEVPLYVMYEKNLWFHIKHIERMNDLIHIISIINLMSLLYDFSR